MLENKRPGLSIMEEPGGMLRKQLLDYDGTVLLDETVLPHDDLIRFMHRPLEKYSRQLTELEKHPLFRESLDVSVLDSKDLVSQCFAIADDLRMDFPEAYFLASAARTEYLEGRISGDAFLRRINPEGEELKLDSPFQTPAENILFTPWEQLVEGDISFDPKLHFQTVQFLDLRAEDPQWKLITAQEQISRSKHGNESLLEKYKK